MIVCWLTLHILAASPVVKTVFMVVVVPFCKIKDKVSPSSPLNHLSGRRRRLIGLPACPAYEAQSTAADPSRLAASRRIARTSLSVIRGC
jgi:hypothetical protein